MPSDAGGGRGKTENVLMAQFIGDAGEVHSSGQREAIMAALRSAGAPGMHISEIMLAIDRSDRNAVEQLLFKMKGSGDVVRVKRAVYADAGKIDKKERSGTQATDFALEHHDLTDLTDLTGTSVPVVLDRGAD